MIPDQKFDDMVAADGVTRTTFDEYAAAPPTADDVVAAVDDARRQLAASALSPVEELTLRLFRECLIEAGHSPAWADRFMTWLGKQDKTDERVHEVILAALVGGGDVGDRLLELDLTLRAEAIVKAGLPLTTKPDLNAGRGFKAGWRAEFFISDDPEADLPEADTPTVVTPSPGRLPR